MTTLISILVISNIILFILWRSEIYETKYYEKESKRYQRLYDMKTDELLDLLANGSSTYNIKDYR